MNTLIVAIVAINQFGGYGGMGDPNYKAPKGFYAGLGGQDGRSYTFLSDGEPTNRNSRYYYIRKDSNVNIKYSNGFGPTDYAAAERMRIENWRLYVETRWDLQDQYKERRRKELSYLDRLERRIYALERAEVLNDRYRKLTGRNP